MVTGSGTSLHVADYVVFLATLLVCLAIGVYQGCTGGRQQTTSQFLMADRQLGKVVSAVSMAVSFMSAITLLGNAAEIYFFGITFSFYVLGTTAAVLVTAFVFVPLYHPLRLTSLNKYVWLRMESRVCGVIGCLMQVVCLVTLNGLVVYGSGLLFQSVTEGLLPAWASVLLAGLICTVYSTMGGFKAVIWTDVFQAVVIFTGLVVILVQGTILANGPRRVLEEMSKWDRLDIDWQPSLLKRTPFWTSTVGVFFLWLGFYGGSQPVCQRYSAVPNLAEAKRSMLLVTVPLVVIGTMCCSCGVVVFGYYAQQGCDPFRSGKISNPNEILLFFVMDVLNYPGVPGLFVACIFAACLSNVSSGINAGSALVYDDLLADRLDHWKENQKSAVTKLLSVLFGILFVLSGLAMSTLSGTLIQVSYVTTTVNILTLISFYLLPPCVPRINWKSCLTGLVVGTAVLLWLCIGSIRVRLHQEPLASPTENCTTHLVLGNNSATSFYVTAEPEGVIGSLGQGNYTDEIVHGDSLPVRCLHYLYSMSPVWIGPFSGLVDAVVTLLVTLIPDQRTLLRRDANVGMDSSGT